MRHYLITPSGLRHLFIIRRLTDKKENLAINLIFPERSSANRRIGVSGMEALAPVGPIDSTFT